MADAVYVRFNDDELKFVKKLAQEEHITRSEAIKRLVSFASKKIKVENAVNGYKIGKYTIREAAESADLRYFEFFGILSKENLIGTAPENTELLLSAMNKEK